MNAGSNLSVYAWVTRLNKSNEFMYLGYICCVQTEAANKAFSCVLSTIGTREQKWGEAGVNGTLQWTEHNGFPFSGFH